MARVVAMSFTLLVLLAGSPREGRCQKVTPSRDAQAVEIVQNAIRSMGGEPAWAGIYRAEEKWTMTRPYSPGYSGQEVWIDDWSQGFLVFNHQLSDENGQHSLSADAQHNVLDQEPSGQTVLPRKLQEIAMPWALPAAALSTLLAKSNMTIRYLGPEQADSAVARVSFVGIDPYGFEDSYTREEWRID